VRALRVIATASLPGRPGRVLTASAVRSSQAQVHVTNFDYNHYLLNTMPGTQPTRSTRSAEPACQSFAVSVRRLSGYGCAALSGS